jgi:hypothetical protein
MVGAMPGKSIGARVDVNLTVGGGFRPAPDISLQLLLVVEGREIPA